MARAASANTSLFRVVKACNGVFDTCRSAQVVFESGQSNAVRFGCGAVRLKNVYIPRR